MHSLFGLRSNHLPGQKTTCLFVVNVCEFGSDPFSVFFQNISKMLRVLLGFGVVWCIIEGSQSATTHSFECNTTAGPLAFDLDAALSPLGVMRVSVLCHGGVWLLV